MKIHVLKQESKYFDQQESKEKEFEVRKNDRDYQVGDILELKRYHSKLGYSRAVEIVCTDEITMEPVKGKTLKLCEEDEADTIKVKVIWMLDQFENTNKWKAALKYLMNESNEKADDTAEKISEVLEQYFHTNHLPHDHVVLGTEVVK